MSGIRSESLIGDFRRMLTDRWGYIPGSSGQVWTRADQEKAAAKDKGVARYGAQWIGHHVADCSGAFVWAYRQHGLAIYHGSNRIAREYVQKLLPPSEAKPGMMAFKGRNPGDKYYDLPGEYKPGCSHYNGDLMDYYHIGLIDNNPAMVINAQSTKNGVRISQLSNGWCAVGWPKAVKQDGGGVSMAEEAMIVTAKKGSTVNLRQGPGKHNPVICQVSVGSPVTRMTSTEGWSYIRLDVDGRSGYMQDAYLVPAPDETPEEPPAPEGGVLYQTVQAVRGHLDAAQQALSAAQKSIDEARELLSDIGFKED